jgi:hypothetical protein
MKEEIRKQLIALGIPVEHHDPKSLSRLFPPEFKVANFDLSQSDVAEILVNFAKRGLITLSAFSEDAAARHASGGHVCHFYRHQEEMVKMAAAFLQEGLRVGDRCLWVLPAWLAAARARAAARFDDAEALGRILFFTEDQVYLDAAGVLRSPAGIIAFWLEQEKKARAAGFMGIRITGEGTGLVLTDAWKSGVDYEGLADIAFKGHRISALCTYSLSTADPGRLAEVLHRHGSGFVRRNGAFDEMHAGSGVAEAIEFLQSVA